MKLLLLTIFLISSSAAYTQTASIKEIKRKADPAFLNIQDTTIIYPIIVTKKTGINKLINNEIRDEILGSNEEKSNLTKDLDDLIHDGLTDISYEITFNKNDILSLKIYTQQSGGHRLISSETYFNFDIKTGKNLSISDVVCEDKMDRLRRKVFEDKIAFLKKYKQEEKRKLEKNEIDSATYNGAIEETDSNCMNDAQIENFSLSGRDFEIIDPCEFPVIIRSQEPTYELKYSYKFMYPFLKPGFQRRLLK